VTTDAVTDRIVAFALTLTAAGIDETTAGHVRQRVLDALGCAIGAFRGPAAEVARSVATPCPAGVSLLGLPSVRTTVEDAAFANTVLVRYLDRNDAYTSTCGTGSHPSDMVFPVLAAVEAVGGTGADALLGVVLAYEVLGRMSDEVNARDSGWDHGLFVLPALAAAIGRVMHLTADQLAHAIAIAVTPHVPLRRTRAGQLSQWKACATAESARAAIHAVRLAKAGMTGPERVFDGHHGLFDQVTGPFELTMSTAPTDGFVVGRTTIKRWPAEYHAQAPIDVAVTLRREFGAATPTEIRVGTYRVAHEAIGSGAAVWAPATRETADHSLAYLLATALRRGTVGEPDYTAAAIQSPATRTLMRRIRIEEDPELTRDFPAAERTRIEIDLDDGRTLTAEAGFPVGHRTNPMTDEAVDAKFTELAGPPTADRTREAWWHFDRQPAITPLFDLIGDLSP
jgi:2-methylcitrate dehydratase